MRGAQIYRPALIDDSIGTCESASSEQDDSFVGMRMVDWTRPCALARPRSSRCGVGARSDGWYLGVRLGKLAAGMVELGSG
ncbi:hypothetical protein GW17_00054282 [Ensete ventricosum]|nr:hypothetical protein GW17_00054282 [Ensete ventricosum]